MLALTWILAFVLLKYLNLILCFKQLGFKFFNSCFLLFNKGIFLFEWLIIPIFLPYFKLKHFSLKFFNCHFLCLDQRRIVIRIPVFLYFPIENIILSTKIAYNFPNSFSNSLCSSPSSLSNLSFLIRALSYSSYYFCLKIISFWCHKNMYKFKGITSILCWR